MKIVCTDGRFWEYVFPADVRLDPAGVQAQLQQHVKIDGSVDCLCLDFAGSYHPLMHANELRLASVLAAAYHNIREAAMAEQASACRV
jgi:hypothetical protein